MVDANYNQTLHLPKISFTFAKNYHRINLREGNVMIVLLSVLVKVCRDGHQLRSAQMSTDQTGDILLPGDDHWSREVSPVILHRSVHPD